MAKETKLYTRKKHIKRKNRWRLTAETPPPRMTYLKCFSAMDISSIDWRTTMSRNKKSENTEKIKKKDRDKEFSAENGDVVGWIFINS